MEAAIRFYLPFKSEKIKIFGNELVAQTLFSNAVGIPMIAVAQGVCGYLSFLIAGVNEAGFGVLFVVFPPLYLLLAPALFGRQLPFIF